MRYLILLKNYAKSKFYLLKHTTAPWIHTATHTHTLLPYTAIHTVPQNSPLAALVIYRKNSALIGTKSISMKITINIYMF